MSRPLRLEFSGALYHVTARGNAHADIFLDDEDRERFLQLLKDEIIQQGWLCYAWCLMDNHYHFLIETPEANLSRGMQRLNGRYTQSFNRSHKRVGHIFQGRYKAILVEKESHLLELCRYIVLNPVRAGMVADVSQWQWSSYHDMLEYQSSEWLAVEHVLSLFSAHRDKAIERYQKFVDEGTDRRPWDQLRGQIYLGGDTFRERLKSRVSEKQMGADIPLAQQHPERPGHLDILKHVAEVYGVNVNDVLDRRRHREAYQVSVFLLRRVCNMSLKEVASLANISPGRVSQIQKIISAQGLPASFKNYKV